MIKTLDPHWFQRTKDKDLASKTKQSLKLQAQANKKIDSYIYAIPLVALFIKVIVMANTPGHGWLGADGESYLSGVDGLIAQGYFSDKEILSYWPAGYPVLIWLLTKISIVNIGWLVSLTQSFFYSYSSIYFTKQLSQTKLRNFVIPVAVIIAINPTLSLSSLSIGYESPIAACMLMIIGLIIKYKLKKSSTKKVRLIFGVGFFAALASFMQPRWVLTSLVIAIVWALTTTTKKQQALILTVVVGVMAIAPLSLIQRNSIAFKKNVISTNLGITMSIGAGSETSGGYNRTGPNVPCEANAATGKVSDSDLTKCVLKWYVKNPVETLRLSWNKSIFFWSPWVGPVANGTMARNPWLKIDPIVKIGSQNKTANSVINGSVGKVTSASWVFGGILLLMTGFFWLLSRGGLFKEIGLLVMAPIAVSFLISLGTIGDHRFRLPTMPLSLFLQVLGAVVLYRRLKTGSFPSTFEASTQAR
jgi:hypothetical protein